MRRRDLVLAIVIFAFVIGGSVVTIVFVRGGHEPHIDEPRVQAMPVYVPADSQPDVAVSLPDAAVAQTVVAIDAAPPAKPRRHHTAKEIPDARAPESGSGSDDIDRGD